MVDSSPAPSLRESADPDLEYRSVEPWAIGGLLAVLLAPLAMIGPILIIFPVLAILANLMALVRLKQNPGHTGRAAALLGLGLSVAFAAAPPARTLADRVLVGHQARPLADAFFEFLRQGSPEKALLLKVAPDSRQQLNDELWTFYRHDNEAKRELLGFVNDPTVWTLLTLGKRAEVRYYKTTAIATEGTRALVNYWYTVTYNDEAGKKTTFLVRILMERNPTRTPGLHPWRVKDMGGGVDPEKSIG
jgi:hypothetical protein